MSDETIKLTSFPEGNPAQLYGCKKCKALGNCMAKHECSLPLCRDKVQPPTPEQVKELLDEGQRLGNVIAEKARRMHSSNGLSSYSSQDLIDELRHRGFRVKP